MIREFGTKYRATVKRDRDDETLTIPGRYGNIYEYSSTELGVIFIPSTPRTWLWNTLKDRAQAAGMTLRQCGDSEGAFSFDPSNEEQCRLALKIAGTRKWRQLSPEHRARLIASSRQNQFTTALQRG
jgi:hypothetical protein